jgi:hypothetical protein
VTDDRRNHSASTCRSDALRAWVPRRTRAYITVAVVAVAAATAAIVSMRGGSEITPKPYDVGDVIAVFKTTGPYTVHTDPVLRAEFPDGYRSSVRGGGYGGQGADVYEDSTTAAAEEKALAKVFAAPERPWTTTMTEPQWLAPAAAKRSWEAQKKLLAEREKSNTRKPKWPKPSIARCANIVVVTGWVGKAQQMCAELAKLPWPPPAGGLFGMQARRVEQSSRRRIRSCRERIAGRQLRRG